MRAPSSSKKPMPNYSLRAFSALNQFSLQGRNIPGLRNTVILDVVPSGRSPEIVDSYLPSGWKYMEKIGFIYPGVLSRAVPSDHFTGRLLYRCRIGYAIIRGWREFCKSHHLTLCRKTNKESIPNFRVIDCLTEIIISGPVECDYAALSYVWGTASSEERNPDRDRLLNKLPLVIEDAISVVKNLDI